MLATSLSTDTLFKQTTIFNHNQTFLKTNKSTFPKTQQAK